MGFRKEFYWNLQWDFMEFNGDLIMGFKRSLGFGKKFYEILLDLI